MYRYTTDRYRAEQLAIDLPVSHARYYRVTVLNRDDQPLTLASRATVTTEYRELLFEAQAGESYRLYYGNAGAERPYYDFQRYSAYLDTDAAARATLGAAIANPDWQPQGPVTERLPWLLPSAVVAIALLLAGVVWRFLRTA